METFSSIKTSSEREPDFISYNYLLLALNQLLGILLHHEQFIISVVLIVGIPGAIWTIVYFRRFIKSLTYYSNQLNTIVFFDALAIVYNFYIFILIGELIGEFDQSLFPQAFPLINMVLLAINIIAQFKFKAKQIQ